MASSLGKLMMPIVFGTTQQALANEHNTTPAWSQMDKPGDVVRSSVSCWSQSLNTNFTQPTHRDLQHC